MEQDPLFDGTGSLFIPHFWQDPLSFIGLLRGSRDGNIPFQGFLNTLEEEKMQHMNICCFSGGPDRH